MKTVKVFSLEELDRTIIPVMQTRTCAVCGGYTWWMAPKQRTLGCCPTCIAMVYPASLVDEAYERATDLLLDTFPGATIEFDYQAPSYDPDTYDGPDAGPCVRCQGTIRRYGYLGRACCRKCEEVS